MRRSQGWRTTLTVECRGCGSGIGHCSGAGGDWTGGDDEIISKELIG
jgi:hypothetical protein